MSYHLRVTHEEVREELSRLGFTKVAEETVEILRKDLLKLIKSDLSKIKQKRKQVNDQSIGDHRATSSKHHTHIKKIPKLQEKFAPVLSGSHAVFMHKFSVRSLIGSSQTSAKEDKSNEESGYSDFGSTTSSTFESYNKRSECSSALYISDYYASKPELPEEETKTVSSKSKRQKQNIKETPYREISLESGRVSTSSFKRPAAHQKPLGRSKVKQVVGRQKVTKVAKDKDTLPVYPSQPDPVTLYHYYKAHWEKFKVPGEDPRSKLRWAVRTRLFYSK
ncbi:uncharacterized protein Hyls1 isoform X1 [Panulirus ornatus]|uniref:uncharacterized protein Hyls1 isoform X1 n=1 Tax=Panulirus ornatus TaxID=150431 RepID=UPI003A8707D6